MNNATRDRSVAVFTPNTCLDVIVRVASLNTGSVSRTDQITIAPGGKGVNVCRSLRLLGTEGRLVGLASSQDSRFGDLLAKEDLRFIAVPQAGESRLAVVIVESDGRATVINGQGPRPSDWDPDRFMRCVDDQLEETGLVVCSGSLPPSRTGTLYADIVERARGRGVRSVVDTSGDALAAALEAGPDLVTPNIGEAEAVLWGTTGEEVDEDADGIEDRCIEAATSLRGRGALGAVVTAGRHGAAFVSSRDRWWLPAAAIDPVNPIGAGDSFVAGVAHAVSRGDTDLAAVKFGMSVATAACLHPNPGEFNQSDLDPVLAGSPQAVER